MSDVIVRRDKRLVHCGSFGRHFASEYKAWCPHCRRATADGKAEEHLIDTIRRILPPRAAEPAVRKYLETGCIRYGVPRNRFTEQFILIHRATRPIRRIRAMDGIGEEVEICVTSDMPIADLLASILVGLADTGEIPAKLGPKNYADAPNKEFPYDYGKRRRNQ